MEDARGVGRRKKGWLLEGESEENDTAVCGTVGHSRHTEETALNKSVVLSNSRGHSQDARDLSSWSQDGSNLFTYETIMSH